MNNEKKFNILKYSFKDYVTLLSLTIALGAVVVAQTLPPEMYPNNNNVVPEHHAIGFDRIGICGYPVTDAEIYGCTGVNPWETE